MYRIQLASGAEAIYRSLEELAVSVQNGIVGPDALVYHRKTRSWLPIEAHPHYHVARELVLPEPMRPMRVRLDMPSTREPPDAARRSGPRAKAASPPQTHQPIAESTRRADEADTSTAAPFRPTPALGHPGKQRSGSSLLMAAAVSGLATVGWLFYSPDTVDPTSSGMVVAGMEVPGANAAPMPESRTSEPGLLPEEPSGTNGEVTYGDAYQQAGVRFEESVGSLGLGDLFAVSRISTADGLRTARRLLAAVRNIVAVYRGEELRIDQAFGMAETSMRESYSTARSVDSLIAATDSIYALLQATDGHYRLRRGRIAFEYPQATAAYLGQAIWLEARLRDWNRNPARTPLTIRPMIAAAGRVPRSQTGF